MNQSSRSIKDLISELQDLAIKFERDCKIAGLNTIIICTYRNDADQQAAYDDGKSKAKPGQSEHNHVNSMGQPASRAFDIGVIRAGKYIGDASDDDYKKAGFIGEALGLEWAGRWKNFREVAHFQLKRSSDLGQRWNDAETKT